MELTSYTIPLICYNTALIVILLVLLFFKKKQDNRSIKEKRFTRKITIKDSKSIVQNLLDSETTDSLPPTPKQDLYAKNKNSKSPWKVTIVSRSTSASPRLPNLPYNSESSMDRYDYHSSSYYQNITQSGQEDYLSDVASIIRSSNHSTSIHKKYSQYNHSQQYYQKGWNDRYSHSYPRFIENNPNEPDTISWNTEYIVQGPDNLSNRYNPHHSEYTHNSKEIVHTKIAVHDEFIPRWSIDKSIKKTSTYYDTNDIKILPLVSLSNTMNDSLSRQSKVQSPPSFINTESSLRVSEDVVETRFSCNNIVVHPIDPVNTQSDLPQQSIHNILRGRRQVPYNKTHLGSSPPIQTFSQRHASQESEVTRTSNMLGSLIDTPLSFSHNDRSTEDLPNEWCAPFSQQSSLKGSNLNREAVSTIIRSNQELPIISLISGRADSDPNAKLHICVENNQNWNLEDPASEVLPAVHKFDYSQHQDQDKGVDNNLESCDTSANRYPQECTGLIQRSSTVEPLMDERLALVSAILRGEQEKSLEVSSSVDPTGYRNLEPLAPVPVDRTSKQRGSLKQEEHDVSSGGRKNKDVATGSTRDPYASKTRSTDLVLPVSQSTNDVSPFNDTWNNISSFFLGDSGQSFDPSIHIDPFSFTHYSVEPVSPRDVRQIGRESIRSSNGVYCPADGGSNLSHAYLKKNRKYNNGPRPIRKISVRSQNYKRKRSSAEHRTDSNRSSGSTPSEKGKTDRSKTSYKTLREVGEHRKKMQNTNNTDENWGIGNMVVRWFGGSRDSLNSK